MAEPKAVGDVVRFKGGGSSMTVEKTEGDEGVGSEFGITRTLSRETIFFGHI